MKKILPYIRKPWVIILFIFLIIILFFSLNRSAPTTNFETEIVKKRDLQEIVSELGTVEAESSATLSFGASGVVSEILVREGETVEEGQVLARLTAPTLALRVEESRARLAAEEARLAEMINGLSPLEMTIAKQTLESAKLSFDSTKRSQELSLESAQNQVDSARRALYSNNLTAHLKEIPSENSNRSYVPPTISGTYRGEKEGEYVITLYASHTPSGYSFRYKGIESGVGSVSTIEPQPLGKNGLFIVFPDNFARSSSIEWVIEIPNHRAPNYISLRNALSAAELSLENAEALKGHALEEAESALELAALQSELKISGARPETIAAQTASVLALRSGLRQAEAAHNDSVIRAPFSGMVATNSTQVGSRVNPGQEIFSLVNSGESEIVAYVPETDIARLDVGDTASIQFDAFRGEEFNGRVSFISPVATTIQGVTRFKTVVELLEVPANLRTGLSADIDINAEESLDVIAVPSRAVVRERGRTFVRVKDAAGDIREVSVTTGLRSSDGYTEIVSGLQVGDEIITYISPQEQARLETEKDN